LCLSGIEDYGYEGRMVMELYTIENGIASLEFVSNLSLR